MLHTLKRYPLASVVLFVGILLSLLCLFHATSITKSLILEDMDANDTFSYTYTISIDNLVEVPSDLFDFLMSCEGNVTIPGVTLYTGPEKIFHLCNLMLHQSEQPKEILISGAYPDASMQVQNGIILGEAYQNAVSSQNNADYYEINGEPCTVTGFIRSPYSADRNYDVNIYYESCSSNLKQSILASFGMYGFSIIFETNETSVYGKYVSYEKEIQQVLADTSAFIRSEESSEGVRFYSSETDEGYQTTAYLSYIYSLVLILISTEFFLVCRKKELLTRKIYGYSNFRIIGILLKDILCYCVLALLIALPLEYLFTLFSDKLLHFNRYIILTQIITILIFTAVLFLFLFIYLSGKLKKSSLYDALNQGRRD